MPDAPSAGAASIVCRPATRADVPFLAEIEEIASTPPFERSMWAELAEPFGVRTRVFLEAMLDADASSWGGVDDFLVLEADGRPAAACAVYDAPPGPCDRRALDLSRLGGIAARLGWDAATARAFRDAYEAAWGPPDPVFLQPQAPAIVEAVGVLPACRGLGLGDRLMAEAKAEARRRGHDALGVMAIHGNDRAHRLYARHFERWATFHEAAFDHRFPGVTKYRSDV